MPAKQEKIIARDCAHLQELIESAIKKNGPNCDLNYIDVSNVCRMEALFKNSPFNGNIRQWNVSNVVNMKDMFCNSQFNGDISKWNVSKVTNMSGMFKNSVFNHSIAEWNVSKVTNMKEMFRESQFDCDISGWNVSSVKYMQKMFYASRFCGNIGKWDVSNVKNMEKMFFDTPYNMDISEWNISNDCQRNEMFNPEQKDFVREYFKWDYFQILKYSYPNVYVDSLSAYFDLKTGKRKNVYGKFHDDSEKSIFSYTFLFHLIAYTTLMDEVFYEHSLSDANLKKFWKKTGWIDLGIDVYKRFAKSDNHDVKFLCADLKEIFQNYDLVNGNGPSHNFIRACIFEKLYDVLKQDMLEFGIPNDSAKRVLKSINAVTPKVLNALSRLKV